MYGEIPQQISEEICDEIPVEIPAGISKKNPQAVSAEVLLGIS